jgi:hypothetical protein
MMLSLQLLFNSYVVLDKTVEDNCMTRATDRLYC